MKKWHEASTRGKRNRVIVGVIGFLVVFFIARAVYTKVVSIFDGAKVDAVAAQKTDVVKNPQPKKNRNKNNVVSNDRVLLDVPLINQMDDPLLYNGCEVSSLAMLLNYSGIEVTKNDVAKKLPTEPLDVKGGKHGNPNKGFVGDIKGIGIKGGGYSVYHEPIAKVAEKFVTKNMLVKDMTGTDFNKILNEVKNGNPVWVLTTTTFAPTKDMETWKTKDGAKVKISWSVHSVAITGFDKNNIYVNDPYGDKNKPVDRADFIASWKQMGNQAITITMK